MTTDLTGAESGAVPVEAAIHEVICPECGQPGRVTLNRRSATDFCARCDFPLFWIPAQVLLENRATSDSLRRLPGAVGRQSVGTAACPQCSEQNLLTADHCIRCGASMMPTMSIPVPVVAPPPAPEPEPVVEPEPEPEQSYLWVWIVVAVVLAFLASLVVVLVLQNRG